LFALCVSLQTAWYCNRSCEFFNAGDDNANDNDKTNDDVDDDDDDDDDEPAAIVATRRARVR
jgi:hypothetical protein